MTFIGRYIIQKFRHAARQSGYETAARRLRKQGIPLEIALDILLFAKV